MNVLDAIHASDREWPRSPDFETVNDNAWPLAVDAATFIEFWFEQVEHHDVEEAICHVPITPDDFGYDTASWHSQHPPKGVLRAHLLRFVKGWGGEKALHDYLTDDPELVEDLGLTEGLPSQATLWRVWNTDRFSDEHKHVLTTIGQIIVDVARENDVPPPDEVFHPGPGFDAPDEVEQDDKTSKTAR